MTKYQKKIAEQYLANVGKELERWQNARNTRKVNNDQNLQETMDKELETHRLDHGPKKRKIPGRRVDDSGRRVDETIKTEAGKTSADPTADADNADCK